jgi:hypothetical protein
MFVALQSGREQLQFAPKGKCHGPEQTYEGETVIPGDLFAEIELREDDEHTERDHLLDDFQLESREFAVADAIGRDLKAVFHKGDEPTHHDYGKKRRPPVFQMTVPGYRHEDVGTNQKQDGFHRAGNRITSRSLKLALDDRQNREVRAGPSLA